MAINNINNKESGVSVRNKLNQLIDEVNSLTPGSSLGITTGATFSSNNTIFFDTNEQQNAYSVDISSGGPFRSYADYGFVATLPPSSATTINTEITLNYPSGTTVTYAGPLIIGDEGTIIVPDGVTLIITSGTT